MPMREIIGATFKTGIGSAISMIFSAIFSKIMALITGPFGIGLYSMIQQLVTTSSTAGTVGGGHIALTQGVACRKDRDRDEFIITVFWIFTVGALVSALTLIFLAPWIAPFAFGMNDETTIWMVRWIALPTTLMIGLFYLYGVLNGFREIGRLAIMQVASSGVSAILAYPVSSLANTGYFVAFVGLMSASISAQIVVGFAKAYRSGYLRPVISNGFRPKIKWEMTRSFFVLSGTLLVTGVVGTVSILIVRALIVQYGGLDDAGIFNVAWSICMMYPTIILGSFGTYYFPTLSQTTSRERRIMLMRDVFRLSTLLTAPLLLLMIVLKPLIINLLYTEDFLPSLEIVRWMLIGLYLKTASWVFSMPMIAFPDMKVYFWIENLWYAGFMIFSLLSIVFLGNPEIIGLGFMALYVVYLLYTIYYARSKHGFTSNRRLTTTWVAGLVLIVIASAQTWSWLEVDWLVAVIWIAAIGTFLMLATTKQERKHLRTLFTRRTMRS